VLGLTRSRGPRPFRAELAARWPQRRREHSTCARSLARARSPGGKGTLSRIALAVRSFPRINAIRDSPRITIHPRSDCLRRVQGGRGARTVRPIAFVAIVLRRLQGREQPPCGSPSPLHDLRAGTGEGSRRTMAGGQPDRDFRALGVGDLSKRQGAMAPDPPMSAPRAKTGVPILWRLLHPQAFRCPLLLGNMPATGAPRCAVRTWLDGNLHNL